MTVLAITMLLKQFTMLLKRYKVTAIQCGRSSNHYHSNNYAA